MDLNTEESSSWLEKDSNQTFILKNGHTTCKKSQVICSVVSLMISTILITLIITFNGYVHRKEDKQSAHSSASYTTLPGDVICIPCDRNTQTFPAKFTVDSSKLNLCCENNDSLVSLIKLVSTFPTIAWTCLFQWPSTVLSIQNECIIFQFRGQLETNTTSPEKNTLQSGESPYGNFIKWINHAK